MKNVFFSILVLFMLAVSALGNVNIAKADSSNIDLGNLVYNPTTAIKTVNNAVDVTFRVANIDQNPNAILNLGINVLAPRLGGNPLGDVLVAGNPNPTEILNLAVGAEPVSVTFRVSNIGANTVVGIYTGTIRVYDSDDYNVNDLPNSNYKDISYSISVQDLNPRITVSGLSVDNELVITSEEDKTRQKTFTIQNSGNIALNDLKFTISGGTFTDGTETIGLKVKFDEANAVFNDVILGTPINMPVLAAGSSLNIILEARIPNDINLDIYSGNIGIASTAHAQATSTTPLLIKIEPEICSDGRMSDGVLVDGPQSGDLRISIDNPDDGDDFNVLDEMTIEGDVENKGNQDLDVIVEAILYDLDDNNKIISVESDSIAVDKSEQESYDITMIVPNDQDIDPDHTYILYIKASDDGNEDQYCNYDSIEVNLDRENDQAIINSFTITPTVAQQGSVVSFRVGAENIGTDEQKDSYIIVKNDELKLNLKSNLFDLKKYDKSGNDQVETFAFTIPVDAVVKDYQIEVVVYYNNERDTASSFGTLTVQAKTATEGTGTGTTGTTETGTTTTTATPTTGAGTFQPTGTSILSNLGSTKTLFIIGDIVLVILAVLFLVLIFKKR